MTVRFTTTALVLILMAPVAVRAQDRGVSIPDVFTPNPADAFVATEVTAALRIAGGMTPNWRTSTADVPLAELMRACGATLEVDPDLGCMARMVVTRDPSMEGGFVLFAVLNRVGEANGFSIGLILYDMRTSEIAQQVSATVERIMAPAARNRLAAEWIRQLTAPPAVAVADPPPDSDPPDSPAVEEPVLDPEPALPTRTVVDTTATDILGWTLVALAGASAVTAGITGGMVLNLNEDSRFQAYRNSWDAASVPNVCAAAAMDASDEGRYALDVCEQADTLETVTHVLWAATGVLALAGAVFIIWHPGAPSHEVPVTARLIPSIGLTQAGLDLTVEF